jgi:TatD DNase family protein
LIDTHSHVHARAFDEDRDAVLQRFWHAGGRYLVEANINARDWPRVREIGATDPRILVTVGVHPHETGRTEIAELEDLFRSLSGPGICAVGETGLDFYRNYAPHDAQKAFFRRHVAVARERMLPLVVHSRAAHEETLVILEEEGRGEVHGVFHCFSGDERIARRASALGFLFGLGGSVTYSPKRWRPLVRSIGLDRIVLETDCPYLTPHPHRNDRNEPANVRVIAGAIAGYLDIDLEEVERKTDANAIDLFDLPE